ncbi:MAG: patatin-like phospholipase family protein, partial [Myxococcota bacterium]
SRSSSMLSIAVVAARPYVRLGDFAQRLVAALSALGPTSHLSRERAESVLGKHAVDAISAQDGGYIRLSEWLADEEAAHRFAVYEADPRWSSWTDRAVGQADRVLIVADTVSDPAPSEVEKRLEQRWAGGRAPRRGLVLLHEDDSAEPTGTAVWLRQRSLDAHYHVTRDSDRDFARLARTLTGRAVGLVLSGGGARGFAHVGVLRALETAGVPIDMVGGTSIGAILGAACALGLSSAELLAQSKRHFSSIFDPTLPLVSILKGHRITSEVNTAFGHRDIEDLRIPFFCVSTNLTRAVELVHDRGSLANAVRASLSLPGVLPPVSHGGDLLIDGGLLNNLPIDIMTRLSEGGPVIAVDVTPDVDLRAIADLTPELSGFKVLWRRINPFSPSLPVPYIISLLTRTTQVAGAVADRKRVRVSETDLYLKIPVDDLKLLDFGPIDEISNRGFDASIDKVKDWWAELGERARATA